MGENHGGGLRRRRYVVYTATLPDKSVYVGRTGLSLDVRKAHHLASAERGGRSGLLQAIRQGLPIEWAVVWTGSNYFQSKGMEIAVISRLRQNGVVTLNRTRGGFYDLYDARKARWPTSPPQS